MRQTRASEYDDTIAFVYISGFTFLDVETPSGRETYRLTEVSAFHVDSAVLTSPNDVWVVKTTPLEVFHYDLSGDTAVLLSREVIGDNAARIAGFIRLADGRLLIAGHQQERADGTVAVDTWMKLYDNGIWTTTTTRFGPCHYAVHETVVQHNDGSIWYFMIADGNHQIRLARANLTDSGLEVNYAGVLISNTDPLSSEGELPYLAAVAYNDCIRLAYQNHNYHYFSTSPFCKGAYMYMVDVKPDLSYSLVFEVQDYTERLNKILSGADWIAYGRVDGEELTWNDLYVCSNGTEFEYVGELAGGIPGSAGINMLSSSQWIAAQMSDGKIHFFNVPEGS
jgi:hypothetical protein